MQNNKASNTKRVIVALDGMQRTAALQLAQEIGETAWGFKVNDLLLEHGLEIVRQLRAFGRVFADPKLHDIPNTMHNSISRLCEAGANLITVHASAGRNSLAAAAAAKGASQILGVTLLTSCDAKDSQAVYLASPEETVKRLAAQATSAGLDGIVCSVQELEIVASDSLLRVCPGIRPPGAPTGDDQMRVATPNQALERGADLLVVGRPITQAADPLVAIKDLFGD